MAMASAVPNVIPDRTISVRMKVLFQPMLVV
jgi:hypothetical protein